ncbi:bifunctional 2-polyprenyl-6-hydroxyphenol methylase/3-demethylubiquinol 3-O-methyltransferase UbiG [Sphingomonas sp. HITSZ_GF]|uniref:bifunctional 2-polyprenyl-6-hydroxyphenol methylase/3-demethylubiquinol 3-O-methyltransferase UbiG n=1 Tax=Sphingomonas sp. HITSZ_GF TaxID=3037247 RepID=UPI00240E1ED9|nr:bifunctional 2-polyprenyl-6-hydroxyphenol methylase/3-demethylubiquinol 3-O-methyltransferase UbiG [Sphingomonas sp. HITSZ_GF]MDG2533532.1 bifunctional 2-polyprenyl-6-hydroxyphenol methylase/3-demethylubiquinol 3-O-methyltransferase UbiG [Sphingomonas sp. HITSZ_GF]
MASATKATIDPREAEHFGKLAADWWNPKGSSAMLHRLNPARLGYIRQAVDAHWGGDSASFKPLAGRTAIDVGCGAGLLAEPLARLGATMTAIDAAPENIGAARAHAAAGGLAIDYIAGGIEDLPGRCFDLVTSMEVIEHVTDPAAFVGALAGALAEGGLMILSTPNRTLASRLAMITLAEGTGAIPEGTHDWSKFLRPEELEELLAGAGLKVIDRTGLGFSPARGFVTGTNEVLNYLVTVVRA